MTEQDSNITPTEIGSHANIAQEITNDLAEARDRVPIKDVRQSLYNLLIAQLQVCGRKKKLPPGDLQDRVFDWLEGDGSRDSDSSEERVAEVSIVRVSPTQSCSSHLVEISLQYVVHRSRQPQTQAKR